MLGRHTYTCRTPENALKALALWTAVALTAVAHIWVDEYFRRVGLPGPFVNGKSLPKVMADNFLNITHIWTVIPAAPSIGEWLFFRIDTDAHALRYAVPRGLHTDKGEAAWVELSVVYENKAGLNIQAGDYALHIPAHLSHYRELAREIRSHISAPRSDVIASEHRLWDTAQLDPGTLEKVHADIRKGRTVEAIKALSTNTILDFTTAVDYVDQWAEDNGLGSGNRPRCRSLWPLLYWPAIYTAFVLWRLYG